MQVKQLTSDPVAFLEADELSQLFGHVVYGLEMLPLLNREADLGCLGVVLDAVFEERLLCAVPEIQQYNKCIQINIA